MFVVDIAAVVVDVDDVAVVDVASNGGVATENFCREKIIFHLPRVEDESSQQQQQLQQ